MRADLGLLVLHQRRAAPRARRRWRRACCLSLGGSGFAGLHVELGLVVERLALLGQHASIALLGAAHRDRAASSSAVSRALSCAASFGIAQHRLRSRRIASSCGGRARRRLALALLRARRARRRSASARRSRCTRAVRVELALLACRCIGDRPVGGELLAVRVDAAVDARRWRRLGGASAERSAAARPRAAASAWRAAGAPARRFRRRSARRYAATALGVRAQARHRRATSRYCSRSASVAIGDHRQPSRARSLQRPTARDRSSRCRRAPCRSSAISTAHRLGAGARGSARPTRASRRRR